MTTFFTSYDPNLYYDNAGVITVRPLLTTVATWNKTTITADGSDAASISTLPNPSTIKISTPIGIDPIEDIIETDGEFSMTTNVVGNYEITVVSYPYQDYTVTILAE